MADDNNTQAQGPQFLLQRIYLKDLSFEAPQKFHAIKQPWNPKISQDLNTTTAKFDDSHYEVTLKITINASIEDKTIFLVEVQQAGLFLIKDADGPQLAQILNTVCPQILFPYAREAIDGCALKGGFPALALPPINFDALFARALAQHKQQQAV
jgi:preprotein translocase subunit SecB